MSQLDAFAQQIQQDPELLERLKGAESEDELVERVLTEAQALGLDLGEEEVRQYLKAMQENAELSDAELETATGGFATPAQGESNWPPFC